MTLDRTFDYAVPAAWHDDHRAAALTVGSRVRIRLHGRAVGGWVLELDPVTPPGVDLVALSRYSGLGPPAEIVELAPWVAWRWAGTRVHALRVASPPRRVMTPAHRPPRTPVPAGPPSGADAAYDLGIAVVRIPPADEEFPLVLAACRRGDTLVVVPEAARARHLVLALRRAGVHAVLYPDEWAAAAAGATVVGTRLAAFAPMPELAAVVVVDEHDEALKEERTPAWHARDVAVERARRRGVPVVMTSPVPSLEALRAATLLRPDRAVERAGWPVVEILDRRDEDPVRAGLFAEGLRRFLPSEGRVVAVLNRKGRARLLACAGCGELVRTSDGRSAMALEDDRLVALDGSETRPVVCAHCGATSLKILRPGVSRAREELEAFVGEPVGEITGDTGGAVDERVVIGTEAVLHRVDGARVVVFLDIDRELLAPRRRASEQALALLARAARLVGGRRRPGGPGRLVVQTRQPDHEVLRAVLLADPSIVAVAERDRRRALGIPPYGAEALVSGAGGAEFVERLALTGEGLRIRGPVEGRWLVRADDHTTLCDALAAVDRPEARVRIEVDPLRV